jgi:hypothetical protein
MNSFLKAPRSLSFAAAAAAEEDDDDEKEAAYRQAER